MAINYPTSIDTLLNPATTDPVTSPSHSLEHANANDAIEALEAKVGVNSSAVTGSIDYKLTSPSSVSPGHMHTLSDLTTPPVIHVYTASGTWTKPAGLKYVTVELVGGGGGGGGSGPNAGGAGGGGGGGGYSRKLIVTGTLGATETVTIGAAGIGGVTTLSGGTGGTTSFGAHLSGLGGVGGTVGLTGISSQGGVPGGAGGAGSGGTINFNGNGGAAGVCVPVSLAGASGAGGGSYFGGGAAAGTNSTGQTAANYGGGGSGAVYVGNATNGGAGFAGYVIVTEY